MSNLRLVAIEHDQRFDNTLMLSTDAGVIREDIADADLPNVHQQQQGCEVERFDHHE